MGLQHTVKLPLSLQDCGGCISIVYKLSNLSRDTETQRHLGSLSPSCFKVRSFLLCLLCFSLLLAVSFLKFLADTGAQVIFKWNLSYSSTSRAPGWCEMWGAEVPFQPECSDSSRMKNTISSPLSVSYQEQSNEGFELDNLSGLFVLTLILVSGWAAESREGHPSCCLMP